MERNRESRRQMTLRHAAYDVDAVRAMERPLLDRGIPLMGMAAGSAARVVLDLLEEAGIDDEDAHIVLLAGAGDNGGDGLYAAARLADEGLAVTAVTVGRSVHDGAFAAFMRAGGKVLVLDQNSNIPGCASDFSAGEAGKRLQTAIGLAAGADVLVDAMTGIGVTGALRGIPAALADALGEHGELPARPALRDVADIVGGDMPFVVAIDTPSGVGVDDGSLPGAYIPADVTVMFGAMKPCAMLPPAAYCCGTVNLVDFGFDIGAQKPVVQAMNAELASQSIRLPQLNDSKYSRGVTGLITGSDRYPGAAVLTTTAAARTNTAMIRYLGPVRAQSMVLERTPETVLGKGRVEAWAVGSGVPSQRVEDTQIDPQRAAIAALLAHYDSGEQLNADEHEDETVDRNADGAYGDASGEAYDMPALCVDAGALDLLPARVPTHVVITPHAGELAQLLTERGEALEASDVLAEPWKWAKRAHEVTGATVLLKGAITIVTGEDEEGDVITLTSGSAPAWLATAGAGDVLAGMMGGMLAQQDGMLQEDAAVVAEVAAAAAYLHGLAACKAAHSLQRGWSAPVLYRPADDEDGLGDRIDNVTGGMPISTPAAGRPIVASELLDAIAPAIAGMLA